MRNRRITNDELITADQHEPNYRQNQYVEFMDDSAFVHLALD
jgi:hypothetical protein